MISRWKYWLAAASVLLTVGAGCAADVQEDASVQTETQTDEQAPPAEGSVDVKVNMKADASGDDLDATVDAALKQVDAETSASLEENADADVVANDGADLNAYGQAYDSSKL